MTHEEMAAAVQALRGANAQPLCDKHEPEADLVDGIVNIHCPNCGFTAWVHPRAYAEMLAEEEA